MVKELTAALLLFGATLVLGYTLLHVVLASLRGRVETPLKEDDEGHAPEAERPELAINKSMGYEFIRVVYPEIASSVLRSDEDRGYAASRGTGTVQRPTVEVTSSDDEDGYEEDDEAYWDSHQSPDWYDEGTEYGLDDEVVDDNIRAAEMDAIHDDMRRSVEQESRSMSYYAAHLDTMGALESSYAVPDEDGEMSDFQRSALGMERGMGDGSITMDDLRNNIGETDDDEL